VVCSYYLHDDFTAYLLETTNKQSGKRIYRYIIGASLSEPHIDEFAV